MFINKSSPDIVKSPATVRLPAELKDIFSEAASDAPVKNESLVALLSAAKSPSDTASIPAATRTGAESLKLKLQRELGDEYEINVRKPEKSSYSDDAVTAFQTVSEMVPKRLLISLIRTCSSITPSFKISLKVRCVVVLDKD